MRILKFIVRITPLRLSFIITCLFISFSMFYADKRGGSKLLSTIIEKNLDVKFKARGPIPLKSKILLAVADEKSLQKFGQWPFDRGSVIAPMIQEICKYNPKVLGFDSVWSEPEKVIAPSARKILEKTLQDKGENLDQVLSKTSGDQAMFRAIEGCKNKVVLGYSLEKYYEYGLSKEDFEKRMSLLITNPSNKILPMISLEGDSKTYSSKKLADLKWSNSITDNHGDLAFYMVAASGLLNIEAITPEGVAQGSFANDQDPDGNFRHLQMFYVTGLDFQKPMMLPSLTLRMAQIALAPENDSTIGVEFKNVSDSQTESLALTLTTKNGVRKIPVDQYGKIINNYHGPTKTFPHVSLADILNNQDAVEYQVMEGGEVKTLKAHKSELFKDAIILFGATANAIYDIRPQPFDEQSPGVENHANGLETLLTEEYITQFTGDALGWSILIILALSMLYGFAQSKLNATLGAVFAGTVITGVLVFDQQVLFNRHSIFFAGHLQAFQLLLQYLVITVYKYATEESEKKFIRSAFDKYVSPAVINTMLKDPGKLQLGGDKKELSVLFSDIRGFTTLSEKLDVKTLTQFLNEYLGSMTEILQANKGTLDKYIGDAVMGFWGAPLDLPDHAELSVKTAVEMVQKLDQLNAEFKKKYDITIDIGIGINSGPVSVGNFGSNKVFEYTVIGDNVNLASRLEGVNKYYGTHIIISETTYALLKPGQFLTREVDTVKVKGKNKPVKIYEVFPDNAAHKPLKDSLKTFNEGLANYYQRKFEQALTFFQTVLKSRESDKPSLELIERCKYYLTTPPPSDWDGSWEMHEK